VHTNLGPRREGFQKCRIQIKLGELKLVNMTTIYPGETEHTNQANQLNRKYVDERATEGVPSINSSNILKSDVWDKKKCSKARGIRLLTDLNISD